MEFRIALMVLFLLLSQECEETIRHISCPFKPLISCYIDAVTRAVGANGGKYIHGGSTHQYI